MSRPGKYWYQFNQPHDSCENEGMIEVPSFLSPVTETGILPFSAVKQLSGKFRLVCGHELTYYKEQF